MALRQAFATVLKRLRSLRKLPQLGFTNLSQSQVSSLESGNSSPTLDTTRLVAEQLDVSTAALLTLTCAAEHQQTPRELLAQIQEEIGALDLLDVPVHENVLIPHPNAQRAAQLHHSIQELKAHGLSPTEVSRRLEISVSTVKRHWKPKA